jgi:hypothetical protein
MFFLKAGELSKFEQVEQLSRSASKGIKVKNVSSNKNA